MRICEIEGCENKHNSRGYCGKHYTRLRRYNSIKLPSKKIRKCKIKKCNNKHLAKGYCQRHYMKFRTINSIDSIKLFKKENCKNIDCDKKHYSKGYCKSHYQKTLRLKEYKLTSEQYELLRKNQGYKCLICGITEEELNKELVVDHSHQNGEFRGFLCSNCNAGIGFFEDNADIIKKAIIYLKSNNEV